MKKFKKIGEFIVNSEDGKKKVMEMIEKQGLSVLIDDEHISSTHYIIIEELL